MLELREEKALISRGTAQRGRDPFNPHQFLALGSAESGKGKRGCVDSISREGSCDCGAGSPLPAAEPQALLLSHLPIPTHLRTT